MRLDLEGLNYFKAKLMNSYAFKETEVLNAIKVDVEQNMELYFNLNEWIDSKTKILHFGNDYGQLDVVLALQEPQRKIDSVIVSEDNRAVAKSNYIVKKRKINYLISSEIDAAKKYDVVLISEVETVGNLEAVCNWASTVIVLHNNKIKETLVSFGFEIEFETEKMIVAKKHKQ